MDIKDENDKNTIRALGLDEDGYFPQVSRGSIISNHTGYGYQGSENFEHENTGSRMNYSGCEDMIFNATGEHEGWEEGYDY